MKHAFTTLYKVKSEIKQEVFLFFFHFIFVPSFGTKSLGRLGDLEGEIGWWGEGWGGGGEVGGKSS